MHKSWKNVLLLTMLLLSAAGCFSTHAADGSATFTFSVAKGAESPTYFLTIRGKQHPRVEFCGKHSTFFIGCRTDPLSEQQWAEFETALADIHFSELASEYTSPETDGPILILCRQAPKKCVRIEVHRELPDNLRNLEGLLARLLNTDRWIHGSVEAVRQLSSESRDVNALDGPSHESTLLIRALIFSDEEVVAELLREGAKPNVRGRDSFSPLQWVVTKGNVTSLYDKVMLLVGAGADVCTTAPDGETPLEFVRSMESDTGRPDMVEFQKTDRFLVAKGGECIERR